MATTQDKEVWRVYRERHPLSAKQRVRAVWRTMKWRCTSDKSNRYYLYGARGIKVCEKWLSFDNFWEDMGVSYKVGLTIERNDNNGNYEPGNCRWATKAEQALNTKNIERAARYTFNGTSGTIKQWAEKTGLDRLMLHNRLRRYGWSIEKALETHSMSRSEAGIHGAIKRWAVKLD